MFSRSRFYLILSSLITVGLSLPSHGPKWTTLANITVAPRQEHTTVFLPPSTIAILGGIMPSSDSPPPTTDLIQFYSIANNTWRVVAPLPKHLNHVNAVASDGKIYVLGGLEHATNETRPTWRAIPDAWVYDPQIDQWSSIEPIPAEQARGSAATGVSEGKIYLAGGMQTLVIGEGGLQDTVDTVSIYDTATGKWLGVPEEASHIPEPRDHSGAAVVNGKFYILGGRNHGQYNVKDTVFMLDLHDLASGWKTSGSTMPTPRGGLAAGVIGNKVYTFGGEGNREVESGVFNVTEVYDTKKDSWARLDSMEIPRHGSFAVGVGKSVYIPGGGVLMGAAPVAYFNAFTP